MKPTGNVTFLFTDIEGSTKLAQDFPNIYPDALQKHNLILQTSVDSQKGFVFKTIGDAFCCSFQNAEDAIKAAYEIQRILSEEKMNKIDIRVRIGINSGSAEWNGTDYTGYLALASTSRIMSAANAGQILISETTYELTKDRFDEDSEKNISFRDLGERRLKDFTQPVRLYQIIAQGIRKDFPPIKTSDARPNNLPVQLTSFIGREKEMILVKDLLKQSSLLTIKGTGGAGKTRFALQTAADVIDDFADGVWFVEIASLSETALLSLAIMKALNLKEEPNKDPDDTLYDFLKEKELLIILDNCEHIVNACAILTERLLNNCPKLKIIATSRESLRCGGEQIHNLLSLEVLNPKAKISNDEKLKNESVRLFIDRAMATDSKFEVNAKNIDTIVEICYQLEGIPLAIELTAAKTKILSIEKILEKLNDKLNLLTDGKRTALPRQQTLRALIDWSYDLLSEQEKILWQMLTVFSEGWTLEAVEEICSDENIKKEEVLQLLIKLAEKSIIAFQNEKSRYSILETIKQYGYEKLRDSGKEKEILDRHLNYYMELSFKAELKLKGSEMHELFEKLEEDHSNFISAINWSTFGEGNKEKGARLAVALGGFWNLRGHYSTGNRLLDSIKAKGVTKSTLGKVFYYNGLITSNIGQNKKAYKLYKKSLELFREIDEKRYIGNSLNGLGIVSANMGNYDKAQNYYSDSIKIFRQTKDKSGIAYSLSGLGNIASEYGNNNEALKFFEESLVIFREIKDNSGIARSLISLGNIAYKKGDYKHARTYCKESFELFSESGEKSGIAYSLFGLANIDFNENNYDQAKKYCEESLNMFREIGEKRGIADSHSVLGNLYYNEENYEWAQNFFTKSLEFYKEIGDKRGIASSLENLGKVFFKLKNYKQSKKLFSESLKLFLRVGDKHRIALNLIGLAGLIIEFDQADIAAVIMGTAESILKTKGQILLSCEQKQKEQTLIQIHKKLDYKDFNEYFEKGKKVSPEEAFQLVVNS